MNNIDYVRNLLNTYLDSGRYTPLNGMWFNYSDPNATRYDVPANYMAQYLQFAQNLGANNAPTWRDYIGVMTNGGNVYNAFRRPVYDQQGREIPFSYNFNGRGTDNYDGFTWDYSGYNTPPTGGTNQGSTPPVNTGPTNPVSTTPINNTPPVTSGPQGGPTVGNTGGPTGPTGPTNPTNPTGGLLGGWNFFGGNNPANTASNFNFSGILGTAPQNPSSTPRNLGGIFSGNVQSPWSIRGIDNWNPSDPRAQNPGAVAMSGNRTYSPRARADLYGAGVQLPYANGIGQYALAQTRGTSILPSWAFLNRTTPTGG